MANKLATFAIAGAILFHIGAIANDVVNTQDMAKALEFVIVDLKKQKEELGAKDAKIGALSLEIVAMKERIEHLSEENALLKSDMNKTSIAVSKINSGVEELKRMPPKRSFQVEALPVELKKRFLVNASSLCIRVEPRVESKMLGFLQKGTALYVTEQKNNFSKTELGWVSSDYLIPTEGK